MPDTSAIPGLPAIFQQFTTATFLAALVLTLVGPFKGRVADAWLPLITMVTGVTLNVGLALVGGADMKAVVYSGLVGVATSFIASGVYSHVTTVNQEAAKASYFRNLASLVAPIVSPTPIAKMPTDPNEAIVLPPNTEIVKPAPVEPAQAPQTAVTTSVGPVLATTASGGTVSTG